MVHEAINGHGHEVTVKVTSASTVAPALPVQEHRLPLSNLDLILPPMDVGVFFCYGAGEGSGGGGALLPAATLKAALAKVLVAYYPLAGEVVVNTRGEGELLCSGRGVDFAEATAGDAVLRQLRLAVVDESAEKLVPKKKAGVMCVQVTKFKCGGAVVGCTFDHRVCDAYSFNMFLVAWAAAARGSSAAPAPSFDRSFLAPTSPAPPSDFGRGRPAFASYHFPWPGGAGYVMPMPSARGDGDWVVYVHAAAEVVKAMEEEETTVFRALESDYVFGPEEQGGEVAMAAAAAVTTTVAPALPTQEHRLPLSNLDLLLPPLDVSVFLCYRHPAPSAAALKEALAKALVPFYPLAGEVVANGDGEPELLCSGRGVDFTESVAGEEMRGLRIGMVDERVEKLVPAKKAASVMAVQVTKFKCGGAVVGCTFDHRVCDAYSFNMFLVAWAAAARDGHGGGTAPPPPTIPSFRRSIVAPRDPPPPRSPSTDALIDRLFAPLGSAPPPPDDAAAAAVNRIYRVAAADVASLQDSAGPGRTKLEAFTAHLWQLNARAAAAAAAAAEHERPCCMGVVVDGRGRMFPDGAMRAYFGNVLTIPYGVMGSGELRAAALTDVAGDVHRWVAEAATGDHFRGLVDWSLSSSTRRRAGIRRDRKERDSEDSTATTTTAS
uniref:Uncharacterized protein n=1 Tax=Oryza barthii TaxID=65489 RepID=A0A0D3FZZ6_9ORYZ